MSSGSKRKYDCISSGSRQFDNATKRMALWKPSAENRPVPVNVRQVDRMHFNWMSDVGEASLGQVTMISPDNHQHVHRYQCTRSCSYDYKCLSCKSRHSVLDPDTITILISDQFAPDSLPPNSDGSCTLIIRLFGLTLEDLCYLPLGQLNDKGVTWEGWKPTGWLSSS